jgi:hypothetical protein
MSLDRILVVGDGVLLGTLRDRFAAAGAVEVVAAESGRVAMVRAALERPALVVCHAETTGMPIGTLAAQLDKLGLGESRIVCVGASEDDSEGRIVGCTPERLFETVIACLPAAGARSQRLPVQILVSVDRLAASDPTRPPDFANLLELAPDSLLVEAPNAFLPGDRLALQFFLRRSGAARSTRISLTCTVEGCADARSLHYEARIDRIDAASRRAIQEFLSEGREARKG